MKRTIVSLTIVLLCCFTSIQAQDFTLASEKSLHSVVYIECIHHQISTYYEDYYSGDFWSDWFGANPFGGGWYAQPKQRVYSYPTAGSGVIVAKEGFIVTNNHVVANADSITVTLNDRRKFPAKIIGTDPVNDLAVIKIHAKDLKPIEYGNSDDVKVGQWVLAVGNPFNLTSTVTAGIVSAKARNVNILSSKESEQTLTSFIQTDAVMNPGNSGGALVNTSGELIGVNAAIASNTGSYTGYSFAIPVNIAKKVIKDIINYGSTQVASAGLATQEIDPLLQKEKNLKDNRGVYVANVIKDASSDKAGIQKGDILRKINGKDVNTASEMNEIMAQLSPNETVMFEIERNGNQSVTNVVLMDKKAVEDLELKQLGNEVDFLGAKVRELTKEEKQTYRIKKGLVITNVEGTVFARKRIRNGFVITSVGRNSNPTLKDIKQLSKFKGRISVEGFYLDDWTVSYYFILDM